jgi:hypothetical protein
MMNEKQQTAFAYLFPDVYHKMLITIVNTKSNSKSGYNWKSDIQSLKWICFRHQVWERGMICTQYGQFETISVVEAIIIIFKNRSLDKS